MALLPLPSQVVSRIRSGVSLVNPSQCLAELILNSIDAGATNIITHLDLSCHKMQVKDNGVGMTPDQMKSVGERYCTSKCHSVNDLSELHYFGYRGEALASLREISGMMEIISKMSDYNDTYCKLFIQGEAKEVTKSSVNREQNGTTITILDFMYNLPVRKKMISETLDLEHCRSHLAHIALIHPHISFTLCNEVTEEIILQTHKSKSILASFVTLFGQRKAEHLKAVHYSLLPYTINGYISLESHISKELQFLYVNKHIILKTKLHKIINSLLKKYLLVCHRIPTFNSPNKSLALTYQDRHAIFVLNISCPSNSYDLCLEPKKSLIEFKEWIKVLNLIEKCICCFLEENNIAVEESITCDSTLLCPLTGKIICNDDQEINTYNSKNALFSLIAKREVLNEPTGKEVSDQEIMEGIEEIIPSTNNSRKPEMHCNHRNQEILGQKTKSSHVMSRFILGTLHDDSQSINENIISDHKHNNEYLTKITSTLTTFKRKTNTKQAVFTKIEPKEKNRFITVGNRIIRLPVVMKPCITRNALHQLKTTKESKFTKLKKSCERMNVNNMKIIYDQNMNTLIDTQLSHDFHFRSSFGKQIKEDFQLSTNDKSNFSSALKRKFEVDNTFSKQQFGITKLTYNLTADEILANVPKSNVDNKVKNLSILNSSQLCEKLNTSDDLTLTLSNNAVHSQFYKKISHSSDNDKVHRKSTNIGVTTDCCKSNVPDENINCILSVQNSQNAVTVNPAISASARQSSVNIKVNLISNEERLKEKLGICHRDTLSGQCIYMNSVNANSPDNCLEVATKDINIDASENKIRSHFFLSHNSTPFLPRPSVQRNRIWTKLKSRTLLQTDDDDGEQSKAAAYMQLTDLATTKTGTNVVDMFKNWQNPVFQKQDFQEITDISRKQLAKQEVKIYNLTQPHNLSKTELDGAEVIGQVDSKFIACIVPKYENDIKVDDFIVLFDQHAVHERIRLEQLIQDLYESDIGVQRMKLSFLEPTVNIKLRPEELRIIKAYNNELDKLGFSLHVNDQNSATVNTVPSCLLEKEPNESKKGKSSITAVIIENILKEWVQMLQNTGVTSSLPKTLLSVLNSQACHGAIKFGDQLDKVECSKLIKMLTSCKLPFQCAHGRPSLVPLVDLSSFTLPEMKMERPQIWKLTR